MIRKSFYNLFGMGLPILVGLFSIPALISALGVEKFGMLTLIWAVIGYFGVFDLGLARAMTLGVKEELSKGEGDERLNSLIWTTISALFFLGVVAFLCVLLYVLLGAAEEQIRTPLLILGCTIPFVVMSNGMRGVLEAAGEFALINLLRTPLGIYTYLAPLFAAYTFEADLVAITVLLGVGRLVLLFLYTSVALRKVTAFELGPHIQIDHLPRLLKFGGWLTVSNLVGPFMGYIDRFFIARMLGLDMVAFYVTPYEIITRLWIVPGAVTAVLFPSLVGLHVDNAFGRIVRELTISFLCVMGIVAPIAAILYSYSWELLAWWIDPGFADQSSMVVEVLAIGIVLNCVAHIPYTLIQSTGNAKSTAIIHLIELPILLISLIPLLKNFGILGAAYAWLIRITLDFIMMWIVGFFAIKSQRQKSYRNG